MGRIDIYKDFSDTPGGRYRDEGDFSGEQFREEHLLPMLQMCQDNGEKLVINFDNCFGFATSFLEEAFGGLVRIYKKRGVLKDIEIVSNDDETIPGLVSKYILAAEKALKL